VVNLSVNILEALELEQVLLSLLIPNVLCLDEFFSLHFSLRVTDLDVIALGRADFFVVLQALVPVLQVPASRLAEVVPDDAFDWRLWSIRSAKCELLIWQRNLVATTLKCAHAKGHSSIVTLSVNVVLWCGHISIDNCSVV
jgi:hypothetical protein